MTFDEIEIAAAQHLAAIGANDIAWPNRDFSPSGQYIEFRHSPVSVADPTVTGGYAYNLGLFLITAVIPAGGFTGAANALAQAVASNFPKGLRLPAGTGNVVINAPANFGTGFQDGAYWRQPVTVSYITEDDAIQPLPGAGSTIEASGGSGFAYYIDTAGSQSFTAGVRQKLTNNAGIVLDGQKPDDIVTFWDSVNNVVTGKDGDDRTVRLQMRVTPVDETVNTVDIDFDIGGAQGIIDGKPFGITTGEGVSQEISDDFELFCGATFEANGCGIFLEFDGDVAVDAVTILVKRGHRAK